MDKNALSTLKESLIYQMSLGSKELYHSNVWAWLLDQNHIFIRAFGFDASYASRIRRVGRENGHRDISIYLDDAGNGPVIVIENKLKSIPDKKQLQKYQDDLGNRFHKGVLTGIVSPSIVDETNTVKDLAEWHFLNYKTIANNVLNILETIEDGPIASSRAMIEEYCRNVIVMDEIVLEKATADLKPFKSEDLDSLGLQDLINKVKAAQFMRFFDNHIKGTSLKDDPTFASGQGFHNKKNTLDFYFRFGTQDDDNYRGIGVQIEENEFRRFALDFGGDGTVFDKFLEKGWFSFRNKEPKKSEGHMIEWPNEKPLKTALTGTHNKYKAKNGRHFVYQYANFSEWSFEAITKMIIHHLEVAKKFFAKFD